MTDGRKRIARVVATLGTIALGGSLLVVSPTSAEPDIDDVEARVEELYHKAEVAAERYNDARENLARARTRLKTLRLDLRHQKERVETVREQVVATVLADIQGQPFSSVTHTVLAEDPDTFLQRMVVVAQYNDQQGDVEEQYAIQARQLEMRKEAAKRELSQVAKTEQELEDHKAEIDEKVGEAEDLLARLEDEAAAARAAAARAGVSQDEEASQPAPAPTPEPVPTSSVSGRAGAAVDYALAQVGDAYVYGAAGPDAFDCSGLTMMAWAQAGVSLPHSSSMQMSSGPSVSSSDLQPGDLVFYYSPVSHVAIYIGNGQIVHAANPSDGVEIAPVFSMPYSGAVRPG